ncbi:MAG TPA: saccharopine dehydrogenase NADP-binding domain-containing protein [Acidimicrobiia bacterium]|nr:saccharopine dehydrogenase NADP-binding domain-containing protein [Acidimicrobiia bacterium]
MGERVAVVGATGYTGGLVVGELTRRGVEVVALGRNPDKLRSLPAEVERRAVEAADTAALGAALDGCRAVVNCVGSFIDHGEAVVAAAVAASADYVDTSGEFPFQQRVFERHDGPARAAGVAVVPGMAFYSAPADLVAALAARALGRPPETVEIAYRLAGARPSRGTLRTNLRRAGLPCPVWEDGRLASRRVGDDPRPFAFPEPYGPVAVARWPGGEVLSVPRHTGARSVAVFLAMPKAAAAVFRNPRLTALLQPVGRALVGQGTGGPAEAARGRARFAVVAEARAGDDVARGVIEGHDLYGVTAAACGEAVQRLGTGGRPAGVLAPAEAFDPEEFLGALSGYLSWRVQRR